MSIILKCPHCGGKGGPEHYLAAADEARAIGALPKLPRSCQIKTLLYSNWLSTDKRGVSSEKLLTIILELATWLDKGMTVGKITHRPLEDDLAAGLQAVIDADPSTPLRDHKYLAKCVLTAIDARKNGPRTDRQAPTGTAAAASTDAAMEAYRLDCKGRREDGLKPRSFEDFCTQEGHRP